MPHSLPGAPRQASSAPVTFRVELSDGRATTAHLAAYDLFHTEIRVVAFLQAEPLASWCTRHEVADALVGGFFLRESAQPLGEVRLAGIERDFVPFMSPWHTVRSCVHIAGGVLRIARRRRLPRAPRGDVLQAGPLLVEQGRVTVFDGVDPEGFSAGSAQFDSDITAERHPRAALGVKDGVALSLTCDGRNAADAGLTLGELAELMAGLGAHDAINLDGGGSATQLCGGVIVNHPRELDGTPIPGGRPIYTALALTPRERAGSAGGQPGSLALA